MSDFFPRPPDPLRSEPEPTGTLDPTLDRREYRAWEVRAAQWRALEVAEAIFGDGVRVALAHYPGRGPFAGLLHLDVPFTDLARHQELERVFCSCAGLDPVLSRIPFVFAFAPLLAALDAAPGLAPA